MVSPPDHDVPVWLKEAKAALKDLGAPNAKIYWTDFLLSIVSGYIFALFYFNLSGLSITRVVCFVLTAFLIFRASSFAHEIVHLRQSELRVFRVAWDLFCGIPLLFPSFSYAHHLSHHRVDSYGTQRDGEYLPFGTEPPTTIGYFFVLTLVWPVLVIFRFLVLTPLSFLYPPLRRWLLSRFSSFGIVNFRHTLPITPTTPLGYWAFLDFACFARTLSPVVLVATGKIEWTRIALMYLLAVAILTLNFVRALCLHMYVNRDDALSYFGQLHDSITLPNHAFIAEWFIPLGLRYHALHHMFPHLPYHVLGEAHRRMIAALPAGSAYHETIRPGIVTVLRQLLKNSWASKRAAGANG
jgi:fatty acid desaturase